MTEYTISIANENSTTWKCYVAKITGTDPNFILGRDFQKMESCRTYQGHLCSVTLSNGLYDVCVRRYDKESGNITSKDRWWAVVVDGDIYEYDFSELNWQYALYTAYNITVNYGSDG